MMIVGKYFNTINDYINIEKCCREYNGLIEQFHFNPIPLRNKKEIELFKNLETYHYYSEKEINISDERIKQCIHWENVSYSLWKENEKENVEFRKVEYINNMPR